MPFRDRSRFSRQQIFAFVATGSVFFFVVGLVGSKTDGFENYYLQHRLTGQESQVYGLVRHHTGKDITARMVDDGACRFWAPEIDAKVEQRFVACAKQHGKAVVILGDSHAVNLYNIIAKSSVTGFVMGIAQGGCRPHNDKPNCHYAGFQAFLRRHAASVDAVIFHQSGSYLLQDTRGEADSPRVFDPDTPFIMAGDNIRKVGDYLDQLSDLAPVVWIGPFVEARRNFHDPRLFSGPMRILPKSLMQFGLLDEQLKIMHASAARRYRYVSLHDIFDIGPDFLRVGDCITYNDKDHFSECGEDILADRIRLAHQSGLLW